MTTTDKMPKSTLPELRAWQAACADEVRYEAGAEVQYHDVFAGTWVEGTVARRTMSDEVTIPIQMDGYIQGIARHAVKAI